MIYSPCLSTIFKNSGLTLQEMIRKVHALGYPAFEFWNWRDIQNLDQVSAWVQSLEMSIGSVCTTYFTLTDPLCRTDYINGLKESISAARRLNCRYLISQTGDEKANVPRPQQLQSVIDGLKTAAPLLEEAGITLVVEPLNTLINHKGHFLSRSNEAFSIVDQVDSNHVKVLYDVYHQQITEGNLINTIRENIKHIGYFHIADHPGRHEIGTGEINYVNVLDAIRDTGYNGFIGLEYLPLGDPEEGLKQFFKKFVESKD